MRIGAWLVIGSAVMLLASACMSVSSSEPTPAAGSTGSTNGAFTRESVVPCDNLIWSGKRPAPEFARVLDAALPVATARERPLKVVPDGSLQFAKQGLEVRRRKRVEITVPERVSGRLWIGWGGNPSRPAERVAINNCYAPDAWMAFAGGYWVKEPDCFPIKVTSEHKSTEVKIAIGAPC